MSTEVKEGFLCPICMKDLGTVVHLQNHFDNEHNEDRDLVDSFKGSKILIWPHVFMFEVWLRFWFQILGLFDKARKILKRENDIESEGATSEVDGAKPSMVFATSRSMKMEPQALGKITFVKTSLKRSHVNKKYWLLWFL